MKLEEMGKKADGFISDKLKPRVQKIKDNAHLDEKVRTAKDTVLKKGSKGIAKAAEKSSEGLAKLAERLSNSKTVIVEDEVIVEPTTE